MRRGVFPVTSSRRKLTKLLSAFSSHSPPSRLPRYAPWGHKGPVKRPKTRGLRPAPHPGVPWAPLPADLRLPIACSAALQQLRSHLPVLILSLTRPRRRLSLTGVCVGFTTPRQPPPQARLPCHPRRGGARSPAVAWGHPGVSACCRAGCCGMGAPKAQPAPAPSLLVRGKRPKRWLGIKRKRGESHRLTSEH